MPVPKPLPKPSFAPQLQDGHSVQLLQGGSAFFPALVQAIHAAQVEVRLETYIFNWDASGQQVAQALADAALRGVQVFVVIDGAGTPQLDKAVAELLSGAGVHWRVFSPLAGLGWLVPSLWRRLHRKLCVVDGNLAFCGGINILDDLFDPNHGVLQSPRFDFAVCVQGPLVRDVQETMLQFWLRLKAASDVRELDFPSAWAALQSMVRVLKVGDKPLALAGPMQARAVLVLRDNVRNRSRIERAYRKAIGDARHEVIIANAYFVPGARLRKALVHAAQRGVRVRLLLQGKYEYFLQYHAARPVWGALLSAGVEIHEYAASFLHAKVAVIDSRWATVGSSNLDPLSLLLAREANVVVADETFAKELRQKLDHALQYQGQPVDAKSYFDRPLRQKFLDLLALGLIRVMLFLTGKSY